MKITILSILFLWLQSHSHAQHRIGALGGWTVSEARAIYKSPYPPGPIAKDFTNLGHTHTGYGGVFYEYTYKGWRGHTGLSYMVMGAGDVPFFGGASWDNFYLVAPILIGRRLPISKEVQFILQGGFEFGLQWAEPVISVYNQPKYWGHVGAAVGVELEWKRYRLGVRGMWGLTDFIVILSHHYRHTALTTYVGYVFYDHAIAKARRLEKRHQESLPY